MKQRGYFFPSTHFFLICLFASALLTVVPSHAEDQSACHGGAQLRQVAELLFGRDIGGKRTVSERDWTRFVARELTPRFPDGLTASDARGQWRDPASGRIILENVKRVEIVLPGKNDDDALLAAVVDAYKREFHQHSVGLILRAACVLF